MQFLSHLVSANVIYNTVSFSDPDPEGMCKLKLVQKKYSSLGISRCHLVHLQVGTHTDVVTKLSLPLQEDLDPFLELGFRFRSQVPSQVERESYACGKQLE